MLFSKLLDKEILCVGNGQRVGFLDDIEIDPKQQRITALICYGRAKSFGLFGRGEDIKIPVSQILVIGDDSILVDGNYQIEEVEQKKGDLIKQLFQ